MYNKSNRKKSENTQEILTRPVSQLRNTKKLIKEKKNGM